MTEIPQNPLFPHSTVAVHYYFYFDFDFQSFFSLHSLLSQPCPDLLVNCPAILAPIAYPIARPAFTPLRPSSLQLLHLPQELDQFHHIALASNIKIISLVSDCSLPFWTGCIIVLAVLPAIVIAIPLADYYPAALPS